MKNFFIFIIWISIGLGMLVGHANVRNVKLPDETGAGFVVAMLWPALIVGDLFLYFMDGRKECAA